MSSLIKAVDPAVASAMLFNFCSSISIITMNKYVMTVHNFRFATTLTFVHFVCTSLGLALFCCLGLFQFKKLDLSKTARLAFGGLGFVVLTNMSLQYNSVGFYQVMKHMTAPTIILIEKLFYNKHLDSRLYLPMLTLMIGVVITTATDFQVNFTGTCFALSAIVVTSCYQIWAGTLQKSLGANPLQLQLYSASLQMIFILPFIPMFDNYSRDPTDMQSIFNWEPYLQALGFIFLTGVIAICVNVSIFMVIGKSSPLAYNILGNAKSCTTIMADYIFFGRPFDPVNVFGVLLALFGVIWYTKTQLQIKLDTAEAAAAAAGTSPVKKIQKTMEVAKTAEERESLTSNIEMGNTK